MAPNVFVLGLKCPISRKNSKLCFFGCNGNFSGSASPNTVTDSTCTSLLCPAPCDSTNLPVIEREAPVVIFDISDSSDVCASNTAWIFRKVDPSLMAIKTTFLLSLLVRTHPIRVTCVPVF